MRPLVGPPFDGWRVTSGKVIEMYGTVGDAFSGVFSIPYLGVAHQMGVIASAGEGWDHVSVSLQSRCPVWAEMVFIKNTFFKEDEWAVEYHPPPSKNISVHPYCLHLWRPMLDILPFPPTYMIA